MDRVGGYRVIRRLSGDLESEMLLAHDDEERVVVLRLVETAGGGVGDSGEDDGVHRASSATVEALSAVDHESLLPLVDFAVLDDARMLLVQPRIACGTVGVPIGEGSRLSLAEAAGVLTSVAGAVEALHRAGWAHGRIGPATVLLSRSGVPVLDAGPFIRALDAAGLLRDLEMLRALAHDLLPAGAPVVQRIAALPSDPELGRSIAALVAEEAAPEAVQMARREAIWEQPYDEEPVGAGTETETESTDRRGWLWDLLGPSGPVLELVDSLVSALRRVRRPFWIGAGGVALALLAALILVPERQSPAEASATGETPSVRVDAPQTGSSPSPEPAVSSGATPDDPPAAGADDISGDDPLAAAIALLALRQRCIVAQSPECMAGATQNGSAAREDGLAAIEGVRSGEAVPGPLPFDPEAPLVQTTGGSAIVTGGSVSVLIVDGEAGWRLRDVFDSPL